jgi:hypothetical protein
MENCVFGKPFSKDIFTKHIYSEGHFYKDEKPGTFLQKHFLKDISDCYPSIVKEILK